MSPGTAKAQQTAQQQRTKKIPFDTTDNVNTPALQSGLLRIFA